MLRGIGHQPHFSCQSALSSQRCICLCCGLSAAWPLSQELKNIYVTCLKISYFQNVWKSGPVTLKFKVLNLSTGQTAGKQTQHTALHMASNLTWRDRFPEGREKRSVCLPRPGLSGAAAAN